MNKKYLTFLIVFIVIVMNIFSDGYYVGFVREEYFAGYTFSELVSLFGNDYGERYFFVDDTYEFQSESEPDYSRHFSKEKIRLGIRVRVVSWDSEKIRTVTWLNEVDNEWVVFSSLEYDRIYVQF